MGSLLSMTATPAVSTPAPASDVKFIDSGYVSPDSESERSSPQPIDGEALNGKHADDIRGRVLKLPSSMVNLFDPLNWLSVEMHAENWTEKQAQVYARLRRDTDAILDAALVANPERLEKAKACDFALFNFLWYPETDNYETLFTASLLTLWLFIWDDYVDSNDGDLAKDFSQACAWRKATMATAKQVLGLAVAPSASQTEISGPMVVLAEFGRRARERLNQEQLQTIYHEIVLYIDSAEVEQAQRLAGYIPTTEKEYMDVRLLSSAVYPCLFALELFSDYNIPNWVLKSDEMRTVFREGNYLISVHNDILSLKKELVNACLINIVPVLYHAGVPWDDILPQVDSQLRDSCTNLDKAARSLLEKTKTDEQLTRAVAQLVDGVRNNCTGNLGYSLLAPRYGFPLKCKKEDGSIEITL